MIFFHDYPKERGKLVTEEEFATFSDRLADICIEEKVSLHFVLKLSLLLAEIDPGRAEQEEAE